MATATPTMIPKITRITKAMISFIYRRSRKTCEEKRRGEEISTLIFFHHILFFSSLAFLLNTPACCCSSSEDTLDYIAEGGGGTSSFFNVLQFHTILQSHVDVILHDELDAIDFQRHRGELVDLIEIVIFLAEFG